jgi:hypothetical protein
MKCRIAGFFKEEFLKNCDFLHYERLHQNKEILTPTSTNTNLKSTKSDIQKSTHVKNRMIVKKLRRRVNSLEKELEKLKKTSWITSN